MSKNQNHAWQANPLLSHPPARSTNFVRMPWDRQDSQAFGPWRLHEKPDPTLNLTAPSKDFSQHAEDPSSDPNVSAPEASAGSTEQAAPMPAADATPASANASPGDSSADTSAGASRNPSSAPAVANGTFDEQHLQIARQQGYVLGIKDGMSKALTDMETERQKEREVLRSLLIELKALEQSPQRFFEPLRRLSLHIAEQLVRGELTVSGQAIDRLVKSCLDDLGSHDKAVVVTVNPDDLQRLQPVLQDTQAELHMESDPKLLSGSVRVRAHDTEIQDFIEHRLESLARRLLNDPEAWLQNSAKLNKPPIEALPESTPTRSWFSRPTEVQDAETKLASDSQENGANMSDAEHSNTDAPEDKADHDAASMSPDENQEGSA